MNDFGDVEHVWLGRLGTLRTTVRQHLVRTQLHEHLDGVKTTLDVGCGQGTQAIELAARGIAVTALDPSPDLLDVLARDAAARGCTVETLRGELDELDHLAPGRSFDLVCAHGVLMYLPDARTGVAALAARVATGGRVSFTVRNGDALALRPGLRGQWRAALEAFDASAYVNELGAHARAHRLDEVLGWCEDLGFEVEEWYGVRVLTDARSGTEEPGDHLTDLLAAEIEAGRRDPYRRLASQLHVIARRA